MSDIQGKFKGCILGVMIGDVLGSCVEGARSCFVLRDHPNGLTEYQHGARGYAKYTDDSEMTLALAKSLIRMHGICDPEDCANSYASDFQVSRGYGSTAIQILLDLRNGVSFMSTATRYIPGGSYGNGSVMRISPIGLLHRDSDLEELYNATLNAIQCTHVHKDAIDAAYVQAAAVGYLCKMPIEIFDLDTFLEYLETVSLQSHELTKKISQIRECIQNSDLKNSSWKEYFTSDTWKNEVMLASNVSSGWFQIKAIDAFCCSLVAFCYHWNVPEDAIVAAIHQGGDTDTLGAITGALAFSLHGFEAIPTKWLVDLEDRDKAIQIATELLICQDFCSQHI
jgi:poly(ADP-ribose) glycohydrolase ARH3